MDNREQTERDSAKAITVAEAKEQLLRESVSAENKVMDKYDLNASQVMFLKRIWLEMYKELYDYLKADASNLNCDHAITREEVADMYEKGIFKEPWYNGDLIPDRMEVTNKVSKDLAKTFGFTTKELKLTSSKKDKYLSMAKEFRDSYPDLGTHSNGEFATKTEGDGFTYKGVTYYTEEDLYNCYLDSIDYKEETHNHVVKLLNNPEILERYMFPKIYRFVVNKSYQALQKLEIKLNSTTDWLNLGGE